MDPIGGRLGLGAGGLTVIGKLGDGSGGADGKLGGLALDKVGGEMIGGVGSGVS